MNQLHCNCERRLFSSRCQVICWHQPFLNVKNCVTSENGIHQIIKLPLLGWESWDPLIPYFLPFGQATQQAGVGPSKI